MRMHALNQQRVMGFVASANPEEAARFYGDVLGLTPVHEDDFSIVFALHSGQVLRVQKVPNHQPVPFTVFGWQVEDIAATAEMLAASGVQFENFGFPGQDASGICTFPNGDKVAWFKDPDGNTLSLAQIA
jgi:catechol 2,3-dioxygenase-like lactoylglutathione lyase family enzyme